MYVIDRSDGEQLAVRDQHLRTGSERRVVVTGIGLVTPLGRDRETSWERLRSGALSCRWLPESDFGPGWAGAPMSSIPHLAGANQTSHRDPTTELALIAAAEALQDAGLDDEAVYGTPTGCVIGTSKGGMRSAARMAAETRMQRPSRLVLAKPGQSGTSAAAFAAGDFEEGDSVAGPANSYDSADWLDLFPHAAGTAVARRWNLCGPLLAPVAACATGLLSLARGAQLIHDGLCERVLAGSTDASLTPAVLASFRRLGVLAPVRDEPASACRPFDRDRCGFLVGEGGAVLLLEREDSALARGAVPYAEWVACRSAADTTGLTQIDESAESLTWVLRELLRAAGTAPDEIDYLNLHGTATVPNDRVEAIAVGNVFGRKAASLPCSSLKGSLGHLLGAAGSAETAFTLLALRDSCLPPAANLQQLAPDCPLNVVRAAEPRDIRLAVKTSLGFGGPVAAALLHKRPGDRQG